MAKVDLKLMEDNKLNKKGKLILVTSINPTPYGEGKTTMAIQIHENMAMNGHKVGVLPLEFGTQHYLESLDERYPHSDNHKKVAILENMALEDRFNDIADIEKHV